MRPSIDKPVPRPPAFEALLWEVIDAPPERVDEVLARCPDRKTREAVRRLLALDSAAGVDGSEPIRTSGVDRPSTRSRTLATGDGLSRDAGNRRRIWRATRPISFLLSTLGVFTTLTHLARTEDWLASHVVELAVVWSSVALSFGLRAAAASRRLDDRQVVSLATLAFVVLCFQLGFFHAAHEIHEFGLVTPFGPFMIVIGLFPLAIHTSWPGFLAAVAASSLSSLAGLAAGVWSVPGTLDPSYLMQMGIPLLLVAACAIGLQRGAMTVRQEAAEGRRLGSYQLEEQLGRGGMGEVWRASHPLLARSVAIKLVQGIHLAGDPDRRERALRRFRREARTTASLQSNHTVRLFDYGVTEDGTAFFVMELLRGIDLSDLVRRFGPQPVDRVVSILVAICDSLAEAHGQGLVHRDVKPANMMLCRQGRAIDQVKVLDFGSVGPGATAHDVTDEITRTGTLLGTPSYLAPEILSGEADGDARSDLYGLGCVAYWLLAGRTVFDFQSAMMQIAAHLRDRPEAPSQLGIALPDDLDAMVLSCLDKDPDARPASAAELASRLEALAPVGDWTRHDAERWWAEHMPPRSDS